MGHFCPTISCWSSTKHWFALILNRGLLRQSLVASLCEGRQSFIGTCLIAQINPYDSWSREDELWRQTWILGSVFSWGEKKSFRPIGSFQNVQGIVFIYVSGLSLTPLSHFFTQNTSANVRGHSAKIVKNRCRLDCLIWDSSFSGKEW